MRAKHGLRASASRLRKIRAIPGERRPARIRSVTDERQEYSGAAADLGKRVAVIEHSRNITRRIYGLHKVFDRRRRHGYTAGSPARWWIVGQIDLGPGVGARAAIQHHDALHRSAAPSEHIDDNPGPSSSALQHDNVHSKTVRKLVKEPPPARFSFIWTSA